MNSEYISRKLHPGFYGLTLTISQTLRHYWQKRRMILFTAPVQWGHGRSNLLLKSNMKYKHNHTWVFHIFAPNSWSFLQRFERFWRFTIETMQSRNSRDSKSNVLTVCQATVTSNLFRKKDILVNTTTLVAQKC